MFATADWRVFATADSLWRVFATADASGVCLPQPTADSLWRVPRFARQDRAPRVTYEPLLALK